MLAVLIATLLAGSDAFAPSRAARSHALRMSFENELGAQVPIESKNSTTAF